jgi:ribose transport system substrate-binding protein
MNVRLLAASIAAVFVAGVLVSGAGARSSRQADVAAAAAKIAAVANVPVFVAPGPSFSAAKARGRSVFVVPASSAGVADLASMTGFTGGIRQAGLAAGLKITTCSNDGTVKAQTVCLNRAVSSKANLVILAGSLDLVGLKVPLAAVKQAKIPVIGAHVLAPGDFGSGVDPAYQQALAGLTATVPAPFAQAARLMADYVTAAANGAAVTVLLSGASDVPESAPMLATVQGEFSSVCGASCTVSSIDVPYSTWQTKAYSAVKTATLAKTTQWLLPMFDQFDDLAAEGEADARASLSTVTRPSICSFGGAPFAIQMGQAANRVQCDIAENMNWDGWATIDQALRVLTGTTPLATENLPLRLWSLATSNWFTEGVGLAGETFPPSLDAGWGDPAQYINGYRTLWGLPTQSSAQ